MRRGKRSFRKRECVRFWKRHEEMGNVMHSWGNEGHDLIAAFWCAVAIEVGCIWTAFGTQPPYVGCVILG